MYGGSRRIDPLIFNLCATWEASGQLHAPAAAPPGIGGRVGPRCTLCGVTTLRCDRVSEKALYTCARRVLHSTGSGKFIHSQVPCSLLTAPSANSNYACPPRRKPMVPTQITAICTRTYAPLPTGSQKPLAHLVYSLQGGSNMTGTVYTQISPGHI